MALTLAGHLHRKINKSTGYVPMNVSRLEILKPLIAKDRDAKEHQSVRIAATAERPLKHVEIRYNSILPVGGVGELHASCVVEYGDTKSWLTDWGHLDYLFHSRINALNWGVDTGKYQKVDRKQAYEAFSSLVRYGRKYHGMKEIVLNPKNLEATALIEFRATEDDGNFDANPYWIDNIAHLTGFILNGGDVVDSRKQVYISHGWDSLQILRPLSAHKSYRNHVKMYPGPRQTMIGDAYLFDGEEMVARVGGVKFQAIPRSLLNKLLPPTNETEALPKVKALPSPKAIAGPSKTQRPDSAVESAFGLKEATPDPQLSISQSQHDIDSIVDTFMSIVADELGLETSELSDAAACVDVGLDSLMSLSITGRLREELEIDLPSSLFVDKATIGEAKSATLALGGNKTDGSDSTELASTENAVSSDKVPRNTLIEDEDETAEDTTGTMIEKIMTTISEELGIERSELLEMGNFTDMGVDSLMSLTITGRIREEIDLDIPTSFFVDYPDISEAKTAISTLLDTSSGNATPHSSTENITPGETDTAPSTPIADEESPVSSIGEIGVKEVELPPATSILLSGSTKNPSKTVFLFPDGSGSATSYAMLPGISPDVCVYGLNCPFMKTPTRYTNGIDGVSAQYLAEIQRRHPHGPYYLGGWSAGGILAYQVAYELLQKGEKTERLFLIDSPCPIKLEPLPSSLLHFIDSMGLLGTQRSPPAWLIPHFEASIVNLTAFAPCPMDPMEAPKTLIIWARDGLCKDPKNQNFVRTPGEAKSVKFLLDDRHDLGANGWDKLIGEENIITIPVQGNHFTMMREPNVSFYCDAFLLSTC